MMFLERRSDCEAQHRVSRSTAGRRATGPAPALGPTQLPRIPASPRGLTRARLSTLSLYILIS